MDEILIALFHLYVILYEDVTMTLIGKQEILEGWFNVVLPLVPHHGLRIPSLFAVSQYPALQTVFGMGIYEDLEVHERVKLWIVEDEEAFDQ